MSAAWSHPFWRILHVIAEKHTNSTNNPLIIAFLNNLPNVIPCGKCQLHTKTYLIGHQLKGPPVAPPPIPKRLFRGMPMAVTPPVLTRYSWEPVEFKKWVWEFHAAANKSAGADSTTSYDTLTTLYGSIDVSEDIKALIDYITKYMLTYGGIRIDHFQDFKTHLTKLREIYGF